MTHLNAAIPNLTRNRRLRFAVGALTFAFLFVLAIIGLYSTFAPTWGGN